MKQHKLQVSFYTYSAGGELGADDAEIVTVGDPTDIMDEVCA